MLLTFTKISYLTINILSYNTDLEKNFIASFLISIHYMQPIQIIELNMNVMNESNAVL